MGYIYLCNPLAVFFIVVVVLFCTSLHKVLFQKNFRHELPVWIKCMAAPCRSSCLHQGTLGHGIHRLKRSRHVSYRLYRMRCVTVAARLRRTEFERLHNTNVEPIVAGYRSTTREIIPPKIMLDRKSLQTQNKTSVLLKNINIFNSQPPQKDRYRTDLISFHS